MDIKNKLLAYGKKSITLEALTDLLKADLADTKGLYDRISELAGASILEPVKNSGQNGNRKYPLFKKYRIMIKEESSEEVEKQIRQLHPALQRTGYLSLHVKEYLKHREVVDCLNTFLFSRKAGEQISRKERSFEIFGREKVLADPEVKSLLRHLEISESDLGFYDTPEYCFHDYIPERKNDLTLLICKNKDIWFNIRRCMFEDHFKSLFGVAIDGVVYGNGNKVSNKAGALVEYVRFMGNPNVTFLYWGDIDREGFDIFRRTRDVNDSLNIELFIPGYRKMIERVQSICLEDSPSSKKEGVSFENLFEGFSTEERHFLNRVLEENKLIPQEIIPYVSYEDMNEEQRIAFALLLEYGVFSVIAKGLASTRCLDSITEEGQSFLDSIKQYARNGSTTVAAKKSGKNINSMILNIWELCVNRALRMSKAPDRSIFYVQERKLDDELKAEIISDQEKKKVHRVAKFEEFVSSIEAGDSAEMLVRKALNIGE